MKVWVRILAPVLFFIIAIKLLPSNEPWVLRGTIGITGAAILLWILQPIPMAITAILFVTALPVLNIFPLEIALKGFSNSTTFLVMAGLMMNQGINSTPLGKRLANFIILKFGTSLNGVLLGILFLPQVLGLFVPTAAVRTSLLVPVIMSILVSTGYSKNSNIAKIMVLGLTFGTSLSCIPFVPAAVSNVLTKDLLISIGQPIYYFTWFKITWPIWLLMLPIIFFLLPRFFPPESKVLDVSILSAELKDIGGITRMEVKCLIILTISVVLWMTESLHHLPTAIPALLAVVIMSLPVIGITDWPTLRDIDWSTVVLMGATVSIATVIQESKAAQYFANYLLSIPGLETGLSYPLLAIFILILITQVYHLGVTNVATVVLTLTPVFLELALRIGLNPLLVAMTVNISGLFGFLLVVETMPNVVTYATGTYTAGDLFRVGFWLTLASVAVILITATFWWRAIGFI